MRACSFPDDFVLEILLPENPVQHHSQIMTRGRVAMQIQAAGGFEDAMQFHQARRHHRQIRHHRGIPQQIMQGIHHLHHGGLRAVVHKFRVGLRGVRPIPGVGEGVKLRLARLARSLAEQDVVIRVGIERGVQVNKVNAGVRKNLSCRAAT